MEVHGVHGRSLLSNYGPYDNTYARYCCHISHDKVDSTIYIDDLVAVYGSETKDTAEISEAIAAAQSLYDSTTAGTGNGQYPLSERMGLHAAIDAAASVMNNPAAVMADLYSATDLLNSAVDAYMAPRL